MDYDTLHNEILVILNQLKQSLVEFLPNLIVAALIFIVGFLIAKLIRLMVIRFVKSAHLLIPNQKIRSRVRNFIEDKPVSGVIGGILYWLLILLFLTIATETLGLPIITTWLSGVIGYLPKILSALLIGIAGVVGGIILRDLVTNAAVSTGVVYSTLLGKIIQIVVLLVTILIVIEQIGIDGSVLHNVFIITIGSLLFSMALAFGIGAKTSVSNILASHYLQKVYKIGDKVKIEDIEGIIIEITSVAVILDTTEGQTCIPSQQFLQNNTILLTRVD